MAESAGEARSTLVICIVCEMQRWVASGKHDEERTERRRRTEEDWQIGVLLRKGKMQIEEMEMKKFVKRERERESQRRQCQIAETQKETRALMVRPEWRKVMVVKSQVSAYLVSKVWGNEPLCHLIGWKIPWAEPIGRA